MGEEHGTQATTGDEAAAAADAAISAADVRKHEVFRKVTDDLKKARDTIAEMKAAQDDAARSAAENKAAEEGRLKELLDAERKASKAAAEQYEARIQQTELRYKLARVFGDDDLRIDGAVARFGALAERPALDEYVASLAEKYRPADVPPAKPTPLSPGRAAAPTSSGDWKALSAASRGSDLKAKAEALQALQSYMVSNGGALPPGWESRS